ncbi:RDD family protein [Kribbella antibiotica]|nr:RDD family protein [Kribbella antibiotica]
MGEWLPTRPRPSGAGCCNGGSTLGMRLTKLKVIRLDGSAPSRTHYLIRYALWVVDGLFWAIVALVAILATPHPAARGRSRRRHHRGECALALQIAVPPSAHPN